MKLRLSLPALSFRSLFFKTPHPPVPVNENLIVQDILSRCRRAIEKLDTRGIHDLFQSDAMIHYQGRNAGNVVHYLNNPLGTEWSMFESFRFTFVEQDISVSDNYAFITETFGYLIRLKFDSKPVKGKGVNVMLLQKNDSVWKITHMHISHREIKS